MLICEWSVCVCLCVCFYYVGILPSISPNGLLKIFTHFALSLGENEKTKMHNQ